LVVAAWEPELRALRGARLERAVVGVGAIEAAAGTARLLERQRPELLILIGTAGVYPGGGDDVAIENACVAGRISLVSHAVTRGVAYLPAPLPVAVAGPSAPGRQIARTGGVPVVDVACPVAITRSRAAARALARTSGASLENLEAFAVARAAAAARVPFAAVLGVANQVGPRAHLQWRAHAAAAAAAACTCVRAFVAGFRARS
jgi:purine-nucleoside phosphorylase